MVTDLDKYRAQFFQIAALCFITPLGKIILGLIDYDLSKMWPKLLAYFVFSLFLSYIGMVLLFKGEEHLEEKNK